MKKTPSNAKVLGLAACAAFAIYAGCGRSTGLKLNILTAPDSDPFASATTVLLTLQGDMVTAQQAMSAVTNGKFETNLEISSPSRDHYVYVKLEAQDGAGQVVGRGRTPMFILPQNDTEVTVYVGRPGQVTSTAVRLPDDNASQGTPIGRKLLAGASLRGKRATPNEPSLGALIVGGMGDSGQPLVRAWRYSPILHNLVDSGALQTARFGAVLVPSADAQIGHQALLVGGADAAMHLVKGAEKFDPQASSLSLLWQPLGDESAGFEGAYFPTVAEVMDSVFLISGGTQQPIQQSMAAGATPLAQAVLVQRTPGSSADVPAKLAMLKLQPSAGMGPMVAARAEHSASPVTLGDGSGALLFGGLSYADRQTGKPVAELFLIGKNSFQPFDLGSALESRRSHVAVTLRSGKVLIAGGYTEDMAGTKTVLDSALLIDPVNRAYQSLAHFLRTPRYAASINLLAQEVLICGGYGENSQPLASCELFTSDDKLARIGEPTMLPRPRAGHLALPLETDQVLLVGGTGEGGKAVAEIDIYTAR